MYYKVNEKLYIKLTLNFDTHLYPNTFLYNVNTFMSVIHNVPQNKTKFIHQTLQNLDRFDCLYTFMAVIKNVPQNEI